MFTFKQDKQGNNSIYVEWIQYDKQFLGFRIQASEDSRFPKANAFIFGCEYRLKSNKYHLRKPQNADVSHILGGNHAMNAPELRMKSNFRGIVVTANSYVITLGMSPGGGGNVTVNHIFQIKVPNVES